MIIACRCSRRLRRVGQPQLRSTSTTKAVA